MGAGKLYQDECSIDATSIGQFKPHAPDKNNRVFERIEFRFEQKILVQICTVNDFKESAVLIDLSSTGLCCVVSKENISFYPLLSKVDINVVLPNGHNFKSEASVCWCDQFRGGMFRVGLRFGNNSVGEAHLDKSIFVPEHLPISGYLYKELIYCERAMFKVESISSKGMEVRMFNSNLVILPGGQFLIQLNLPKAAKQLKLVVGYSRSLPNGELKIGFSFDKLDVDTENAIVHSLLSGGCSPEDIKASGLNVRKISDLFSFHFVRTHEEYLSVLNLRYAAYKEAGKINDKMSPASMITRMDSSSRILYVKHLNKMVASVSLSFAENTSMVLDTESAFPGGYPNSIPDKLDCMEVSRLCIESSYRRGDLLFRIFEHVYRVFANSGRSYIITSTDRKLWPIYKNLGFYKTGIKYDHPYLVGISHDLILINKSTPIFSKDIDLSKWHVQYNPMTNFMLKSGEFKMTYLTFVYYRLLERMSQFLFLIKKFRR